MSTQTKKQWHDVDIKGRWKLIYKYGNSNGPEAFGGKHLGTYKSPFDGTKVYRRSVDNKALAGFMIDKLAIDLTPDTNNDHRLLISWLICHPEVQIEGVPKLDEIIKSSKEGRKVYLKCVDYVEMEAIDEEDYIDKTIGRLVLDHGVNAIGLDKLRHILAALNMPYTDNRFVGAAEKKALRSKLKRFTRSSLLNAKAVQQAINNLDESKDRFTFKEMLKLKVLQDFGGLYKFNNVPVGTSYEKVLAFWDDNPEVKAEALQELSKLTN
jgi:hypothetical protein